MCRPLLCQRQMWRRNWIKIDRQIVPWRKGPSSQLTPSGLNWRQIKQTSYDRNTSAHYVPTINWEVWFTIICQIMSSDSRPSVLAMFGPPKFWVFAHAPQKYQRTLIGLIDDESPQLCLHSDWVHCWKDLRKPKLKTVTLHLSLW